MGCDLIEDMMIVSLFTRHEFLMPVTYAILRFFTWVKIAAVLLSFFQAAAVALAWVLTRFGFLQRWL